MSELTEDETLGWQEQIKRKWANINALPNASFIGFTGTPIEKQA